MAELEPTDPQVISRWPLALAVLLVAVHLPLALVRWRAAGVRRRNLEEYARRRSAAKPAFF